MFVLVSVRVESSSGVRRDFFKKAESMERSGRWPLIVSLSLRNERYISSPSVDVLCHRNPDFPTAENAASMNFAIRHNIFN